MGERGCACTGDEPLAEVSARHSGHHDLGGLRGGISVALALSLPSGSERELVLAMTYVLVVFSILVQGLTIKQVVMWFMRSFSIAVKS